MRHSAPPRTASLSGKTLRLRRIFSAPTGRALIVPIDHSVTVGPLGRKNHADWTAAMLAEAGADALVVHKGRARHIDPAHFRELSLIVHLSAGTSLSVDTTSKVLVGSVEEAMALGADAVSIHVNIGSPTEAQQLNDLGVVSDECARLGIPLLAMMYNRGMAETPGTQSVATLSHLAAIATDLGADIVKLDYAGDRASMDAVADSCPLPIVVAGGAYHDDESAIEFGTRVAESSVAGLSFGRHVFGARNPARVAAALAHVLHTGDPARPLENFGSRTGL
ncbi:2-amino-3,7-dideoxy-D-threo-hept-6-ulosonate synthase [Gordonia sp. PS3]|uniref:Putative aldolase n=1 Tax=Gordonia sihwensis NBRC 108236 TaxID=1223544 RepID=L7LMD4_9ACTN|nr:MULTISPECIES: 2-amino-3,7-dideoxy-D-threo-hept-6-ulosonate synthase [Gordonia]AUH69738.1 transaldolase [Gordonia sp. YC-JH1]KJR06037.1 transaldolase [Gordonia sihwensis]WFN93672.1 2-amino-3,7-dideoxy-D-threo-hept-6-ulosonate synthase [Gordonia sihwensis]GAC62305.1 putative aldolase [Gordonia sihwensis NBRC 108236]